MEEIVLNLHIHTRYSDGSGTHQSIAHAAIRAGIDVIITTDHNVLVSGVEDYFRDGKRKVLLLTGEEIHNPGRDPQKSHMLVFGVPRELASYASDPQNVINQVDQAGGLAFLAHPYEDALPLFHQTDISWDDWEIQGYTGIELWNGLSELKSVIHNTPEGLYRIFFPQSVALGPNKKTLKKWDELLSAGRRVVAVGGADAHALHVKIGPFQKIVFPYLYHFQAINNHVLIPQPLSGDVTEDRNLVLSALRAGHSYIGYDLPASTRGFRFTAQGTGITAIPGDWINVSNGVTFQVRIPGNAHCRLIRDGEVVQTWDNQEIRTFLIRQPGVYRVECYTRYWGKLRGWIFSNPIYVTP